MSTLFHVSIACPQTGSQCTRSVCLQAQSCVLGDPRDVVQQQVGWKCPVCGKGNAPFQKLCANAACGIDFTKGAQC
jgi:hypothetical protein